MEKKRKKAINTKVVEKYFFGMLFLTAIPIAIGRKVFICKILIQKDKVRKALPVMLFELLYL